MILESLVSYYHALAAQGKIDEPGWAKSKISWALEIDYDGNLLDIYDLREIPKDGKKKLARQMVLPAPVKKTSGERSNFLWENAEYLLGIFTKDNPEKAVRRFETAKELHQSLLSDVSSPEAKAIVSYFEKHDPSEPLPDFFTAECMEDLRGGGNLTFSIEGKYAGEFLSLKQAWNRAYDTPQEGEWMIDLVTGEVVIPETTHPSIKNVVNAQSSGAALISFNSRAFESYGKDGEQNISAPMGKSTAFAYTTALNYLTADKKHKKLIGDMTVVYWTKSADALYQDTVGGLLDGLEEDSPLTQDDLDAVLKKISQGIPVALGEQVLSPDEEFYLLGISPNAARLSIRFFYRGTFGSLIANVEKHDEDIAIDSAQPSRWRHIPLWALLKETVNQKSKDKNPSPQMAGDLLRAVLAGGRYPRTLLCQTFLRIRAEHEVTPGRAAIVKAFLIRNTTHYPEYPKIKEVAVMALNEESNYTPYVLGRLFSVLEDIQKKANPTIQTTIKDRYFNSACATPAAVFPILMKLSNSHLAKLSEGSQVFYQKRLAAITGLLGMTFPRTLTLEEQGAFVLGYYHQTQKRYEKNNQNTEDTQND